MQYYYTHTYIMIHVHACPGATGTHIVYMRSSSFVHALAEVVLKDVCSRDGVFVHTYISSISTCTGGTVRERAPLARRRAMSAPCLQLRCAWLTGSRGAAPPATLRRRAALLGPRGRPALPAHGGAPRAP